MKWSKWLENWNMTSLKINASFLEMEWKPQDADKDAAWELYIEMLTRIATQYLQPEHGHRQSPDGLCNQKWVCCPIRGFQL